jgi:hypothetical protein
MPAKFITVYTGHDGTYGYWEVNVAHIIAARWLGDRVQLHLSGDIELSVDRENYEAVTAEL